MDRTPNFVWPKWRKMYRRAVAYFRPLEWLRCHTVDRYHIINISGQDGYKWGWIDRDHAMYLACFKLLEEYVELEKPDEVIDWESDPDSLQIWKEIQDLYHWWKTGRAAERAATEAILGSWRKDYADLFGSDGRLQRAGYDDPRWKAYMAKNLELEDKDEAQLLRLIKIRRSLWT